MMRPYENVCLFAAWLIAIIATISSLYGSEIAGLSVCHLCWYQRICIYPLTIIIGIGAFQGDIRSVVYAVPLSVIGALFAIYQYLEQMIPGFAPISFCTEHVPCSTIHLKWFGFITYPLLSFAGCVIITILLTLARLHNKKYVIHC